MQEHDHALRHCQSHGNHHAARRGRAAVPRHARARGDEPAERVSSSICSARRSDINLDDILGKNVTVKLALPDDSDAVLQRLRDALLAGRHVRPLPPLHATVRPWLWFLTRTADCRIFQEMTVPDIVKEVFARSRDGRLQVRADRHLPQVDLLRAVPRDRLQLRQPADGAGGHLLLLPAHRRPPHAGADRLDRQAHAGARLRDAVVHLAGAGGAAGARAHQQLGLRARDSARRLRARRLRPRAAERRAARRSKALPRSYTPSDYEVYDYPGHYLQKADGEQYAAVRIDEFGSAVRDWRTASTNARGRRRSGRCSRSRTTRATIRTAST